MELYLAPTSPIAHALYEKVVESYLSKPPHERDAGLDAVCVESRPNSLFALPTLLNITTAHKLDLGVRAAVFDKTLGQFRAFWLMPRSSISKSPLRMANSMGLIDAGYRGPLMAAVDVSAQCRIEDGDRYFQIVAADLLPWSAIHIVSELPGGATLRGEGGFGSTGKSVKNE